MRCVALGSSLRWDVFCLPAFLLSAANIMGMHMGYKESSKNIWGGNFKEFLHCDITQWRGPLSTSSLLVDLGSGPWNLG